MDMESIRNFNSPDDDMKGRFITFHLEKEVFGIPLHYVMEIVNLQPITPMPDMADFMKGIINLRGKVIPVMDIRVRMGKAEVPYNRRTCIIVIKSDSFTVGVIVDSVSEVVDIPVDSLAACPNIQGAESNLINKIGQIQNQTILLLDCGKLVSGNFACVEQPCTVEPFVT